MSRETEDFIRRCATDFEFYANGVLKIRRKRGGEPVPFVLNRVQRYLHQRLEDQRQRTGMVRALVLKSRQQGASTYIEGRLYWKTSLNTGMQAYILTHEQAATNNLFAMADTFYRHSPPDLRPVLGQSNEKALAFSGLGSGYTVGTAGSKDTGRSSTAQLFHGSEVAFWANADAHMAGIGQIVARAPNTEIIHESTAYGVGNTFHGMWQAAEAGTSEFIAIFSPWFWSLEYDTAPPAGFEFEADDLEYQQQHGVTDGQLYWRRMKINTDFGGGENGVIRFQQEYPATAAEAFVVVGHNPFIPVAGVLKARKAEVDPFGARVLGVDPARYGGARTALVWRQGRKVYKIDAHSGLSTMQIAGLVARELSEARVDKVFIDEVGLGAGVVDRLLELGYGSVVVGVQAGASADEPKKYLNKRAEMWDLMRMWFDGTVQIPESDELHADIVGLRHTYESSQRLKLERKEDMEKRGVRSPDLGDALALTFAFPVAAAFDRSGLANQGYGGRRVKRDDRDWRAR
jgi:hypothetical protein